MSPAEYDTKKVKRLIREMEKLLASNPTFDAASADMIIRNLVAGLKIAASMIEYMKEEAEFEARVKQSGMGSNAKH